MNSDDEDRDSSSHRGSSLSEDDDSDTDIATVLTQLIRRLLIAFSVLLVWCTDQLTMRIFSFSGNISGRAHILSERNSVFEERGESFPEFLSGASAPLVDTKPDLTVLEVRYSFATFIDLTST